MLQKLWTLIAGWFGFANDTPSPENPPRRQAPQPTAPSTSLQVKPSPPAAVVAPIPPKQYEGKAFGISDAQRSQAVSFMYKQIDGELVGPTMAQQSVIFSDAAATTVLAGAGSGKSTTLVQRVLFLNKVLKIDLALMAVFTFTRKSRRDFITKLVKEAPNWGVELDEKQAERLVRTFHSKALNLSQGILKKGEQIFEFLDKPKKKLEDKPTVESDSTMGPDLAELEQLANEIDPFPELDGKEKQAEFLKDVFTTCYNKSDRFRAAIYRIFEYTLITRRLPKDDAKFVSMLKRLQRMSSSDLELSKHVEAAWRRADMWPVPGVTPRGPSDNRFQLKVMGETFYANGYIEALDIFVVLGACPGIDKVSAALEKLKVKPMPAIFSKRRALLAGCENKIRFVGSKDEYDELRMQLRWLNSERAQAAPAVKLRLPGETAKLPFEALYGFGSFVETIGLQPNKLTELLQDSEWSEVEQATITAVSEFYGEFYDKLTKRGLITFNQVFAKLGDGSPELQGLSISSLIGVKHLLIDEFQDISPLIVRFVRGIQGELLRKSDGTQRPTLMSVGDDWQSIYGWRGSSPHFLLKLKDYFPGATGIPIQMEENFRSSQKIVDAGQVFIGEVAVKSAKRCIAAKRSVMHVPHIVGGVTDYAPADVKAAIYAILEQAEEGAEIYLLAATHTELNTYQEIRDKRLMCTTYHQSKGLEADYVILVGSPRYFGANDLKNALYRTAGFPQTFDAAQKDEAFRVAYVAVTRAKKFCIWFAEATPGSVIEAVPANGIHRLLLEKGLGAEYAERCVRFD